MTLTGKQKRHLRGLGHHLNPVVQIGKDGVSDTLLTEIDRSLEAHELIKIKALESCEDDIKDIAQQISRGSKAELVQTLGHTALLYRQRKENSKIEFPDEKKKGPAAKQTPENRRS
jgi:RNA-binding protein